MMCGRCKGTGKVKARFMGENPDIPEPPAREVRCFPCRGTGEALDVEQKYSIDARVYPEGVIRGMYPDRDGKA